MKNGTLLFCLLPAVLFVGAGELPDGLMPPAGYLKFERTVKLTDKWPCADFDVECYEQANGPTTRQRVMMAVPKTRNGKLAAVVVPFYFPEAMLGFDPATGSVESPLAGPKSNLRFYSGITYMADLARCGYIAISADAYHLTYAQKDSPPRGLAKWAHAGNALVRDWPGWTGIGKLAFDTRLLVDMLCADKRVDASRIGIIGHSLGGKMAFYAGCLDPRIKVIVASDFGMRWERSNWNAVWYWGRALERVKTQGFDHSVLLAAAGGKPFCLIAGHDDDETSQELVRRTKGYETADESRFLFINHARGHRPPSWATEKGYRFLDRHLRR